MPCGFGRHCVPLARAGYRVTGVDRSGALLEEARRRAAGERWPKFTQADYRDLPFKDESFDAALNLFTSLGYLGDEEDTKVLAQIRRVLRPGGKLVLETMHRDRLIRQLERQRLAADGGGTAAARAAHVRSRRGRRADDADARGDRRHARVTHVERPRLQRDELVALARSARGFAEVKCWGGFEHEPFTPDTALSSLRGGGLRG